MKIMKTIKPLCGLLLSAALTAGVLTGCAGGADGGASSASAPQGGDSQAQGTQSPAAQEPAAGGELNLFTWDGYFPQDVLDGFTQQTGVKINISNFETNEEMMTKLEAAGAGDYDVIVASDYIIEIMSKRGGLLKELDKGKIPNFSNLDEAYLGQFYDPENKYAVPYAAGTPLIVYDPALVTVEISGYADLWKPELKDSIVAMDDARNMIGITLKSLGKSFNETDPEVLEQARQKILELKPNIRTLAVNNLQDVIISGEASVGYMFTPQVVQALQQRPDLKVVYPAEGMGFGIDNLIVPANAPHTDNAWAFLNYILDPQVGAKVSSQVLYLCPNKASVEFLPEEYKQNEALFIPSDVLGNTEFIQDVGEATELYDRIWTEFKQQ